ncbi:MAG: tRNA epoxyqueuosine(34) reductase QueG [Alphaproteobacteria bacterium]
MPGLDPGIHVVPPRKRIAILRKADIATADPAAIKVAVLAEARALGFDAAGVADPGAVDVAGARFRQFIELGRHGDMAWLAAKANRREAPAALWPEVRAVVMVAMNYAPPGNPLDLLDEKQRGVVSAYARGRDYHDVLKKRLKALARWLVATQGGDVKVFVDTAPVLEKPLAAAAGLGWQGKHTNLVSREFGSWLFLGALYTTLPLPPDTAHDDRCGSCRQCLDVCPTDAFPAPYQLDARRCIAYLTIEHPGHIEPEFREAIGNRVFGCDDCLAVCPWNKYAQAASETRLVGPPDLAAPDLRQLAALDDAAFRQRFAGTPVKRLGRDRFVRNVLIAIGNSADPALADAAEGLLRDPSPLVRAMAVWALGRLAPQLLCSVEDQDAEVRRELVAARL